MCSNLLEHAIFAINNSNINSIFKDSVDYDGSWNGRIEASDFLHLNRNSVERYTAFVPLTHGFFEVVISKYGSSRINVVFSYKLPSLGRYKKFLHADRIERTAYFNEKSLPPPKEIDKLLAKKLQSLCSAVNEFHTNRSKSVTPANDGINMNYILTSLSKAKSALSDVKLKFDSLNKDDSMLKYINNEIDRLHKTILEEIKSNPTDYTQYTSIDYFY